MGRPPFACGQSVGILWVDHEMRETTPIQGECRTPDRLPRTPYGRPMETPHTTQGLPTDNPMAACERPMDAQRTLHGRPTGFHTGQPTGYQ